VSDTAWAAAIATLITGPIIAILTWFSKSGVDAWKKMRQQRHEEMVYEDQKEVSSHEVLIKQLTTDLHEVRVALADVQTRELECVRRTGMLEGKCSALEAINTAHEQRFADMNREIESLRDWRHAMANQAHTAVIKAKVKELQDSGEHDVSGLRPPTT
jgi:chromosome segregation ATPase